jgi:hypothetical protein
MVKFTVAGKDADDMLLESVLLSELDEHAKALFAQVSAIECGCAIVKFLQTAGDSFSMTDGIAFRLNRSCAVIESGLNALEKLGVVRRMNLDDLTFWGMAADPEVRQLARDLAAWQTRWSTCLERVAQAISGPMAMEPGRAQ